MAYSPLRALQGVGGGSCSMLHARGTALACKPVRALQGVAGVSCSMLHARGTALACKPVRALQGGIQRLSLFID